jgi:hypothetical protein
VFEEPLPLCGVGEEHRWNHRFLAALQLADPQERSTAVVAVTQVKQADGRPLDFSHAVLLRLLCALLFVVAAVCAAVLLRLLCVLLFVAAAVCVFAGSVLVLGGRTSTRRAACLAP